MDPGLARFTIPLRSTVLDGIEAIKSNRSRCVIVVDADRVVGVLSEGDIMSALLHGSDVRAPIEDFVRHNFKFLSKRSLPDALDLMRRFGVTLVPVVDRDLQLREVVTLSDVLNSFTLGQSL